jgi:hypothetical protein
MPFGDYKLCLYDNARKRWQTVSYDNKSPDGNQVSTETDITVSSWNSTSSSASSICASKI